MESLKVNLVTIFSLTRTLIYRGKFFSELVFSSSRYLITEFWVSLNLINNRLGLSQRFSFLLIPFYSPRGWPGIVLKILSARKCVCFMLLGCFSFNMQNDVCAAFGNSFAHQSAEGGYSFLCSPSSLTHGWLCDISTCFLHHTEWACENCIKWLVSIKKCDKLWLLFLFLCREHNWFKQ